MLQLPVDEVSYQAATAKSRCHCKRERSTRQSKADTSNEDHGLQSFAKDGDEWQHEHSVLFAPGLEAGAQCSTLLGAMLGLKSFCELDTPFVLEFRHPEEGCTHDRDDYGREDAEGSFPDVFCTGPAVFTQTVEGSYQTTTHDDADDQAKYST